MCVSSAHKPYAMGVGIYAAAWGFWESILKARSAVPRPSGWPTRHGFFPPHIRYVPPQHAAEHELGRKPAGRKKICGDLACYLKLINAWSFFYNIREPLRLPKEAIAVVTPGEIIL